MNAMSTKNPKTKADWGEIANKNKELTEQMKKAHFTYIDMTDIEFKNSLEGKTLDQLEQMMVTMKGDLRFYKKVLQEAYYVDKPEKKKTYRYKYCAKNYKSVNAKGKIIHSLINHLKN